MCMWHHWNDAGKAAVWFLGQSGFYLKSGNCSVVIDPYLSDSAGDSDPFCHRAYPVPLPPDQLKADIYIATHDHLDHLDPVTVKAYQDKEHTIFISPRYAALKLEKLGVPKRQIQIVDQGDCFQNEQVKIQGIFALGTGVDVIDTAGYQITFRNGKSVYHTSDTSYCQLLLKAAPKSDVLLTCINGKFGNLNIHQAVKLAAACEPEYIIPHHYDGMELNRENPEAFHYVCKENGLGERCRILSVLEKFEW